MALKRRIYVISDLHLGGTYGDQQNPEDRGFRICTRVDAITTFIDSLTAFPSGPVRTELVINGDMVDFLAEDTGAPGSWTPFVADGEKAATMFKGIVARDRHFFDALARFLTRGHHLVVLLGNHDVELALPAVQREFYLAIKHADQHGVQFVQSAEPYIVGDALIEHGNRYDEWNVVDHEKLLALRAFQMRRQPVPLEHRVKVPAGSEMVSSVINPVKAHSRFVDLLKPETDAVLPLLLAIAPKSWRQLKAVAALRFEARKRKLRGAATPGYGDIYSAQVDPLHAALAGTLKGKMGEFLSELGEASAAFSSPVDPGVGDIASMTDRTGKLVGITRLLLSPGDVEGLERRLPALLMALRVLRDDKTFDRGEESLKEFSDAAEALTKSFRYVVFGHTHLARDIRLKNGARYLNSGTWADLLELPPEIVSGPRDEALPALEAFVRDLVANRLSKWVRFTPTYVRLDLDDGGAIVDAALRDFVGGEEP